MTVVARYRHTQGIRPVVVVTHSDTTVAAVRGDLLRQNWCPDDSGGGGGYAFLRSPYGQSTVYISAVAA